jgi:hypothetical protein
MRRDWINLSCVYYDLKLNFNLFKCGRFYTLVHKKDTDQRTLEEFPSLSFLSVFLYLQRRYWFPSKGFFLLNGLLYTSGFPALRK